jgi:catechol 2,3-dioxygenase-like lactoylglutathione lyase family enzyme
MSLLRVGHVNLSIDDVDAARAFYGELLGLAQAPRPPDAGRPGCWFSLGDVELHLSLEAEADNESSRRHVAFEVADLEALRARFEVAGLDIEPGRTVKGVERFFVRDPAGNRLEMYARVPQGETGALDV